MFLLLKLFVYRLWSWYGNFLWICMGLCMCMGTCVTIPSHSLVLASALYCFRPCFWPFPANPCLLNHDSKIATIRACVYTCVCVRVHVHVRMNVRCACACIYEMAILGKNWLGALCNNLLQRLLMNWSKKRRYFFFTMDGKKFRKKKNKSTLSFKYYA